MVMWVVVGFDGLRCRAWWGLLMVMWVVRGLMGSVMGCDGVDG